jgi:hypothetical protein
MSGIWPYIAALIPSVGVGVLFWVVIKNMIEGDRKERLAHSQWEREQENSGGNAGAAEKQPSKHSSRTRPPA